MPPSFVIAIFAVFAVLALVSIVYSIIAEKKRKVAIESFAQELGLQYFADLPENDAYDFYQFNISRKGRGQSTRNAIIADSGALRMVIFDFQFTTGSGKNKNTHRQTIMMATSSESLQLPQFTISPEGFMHRLGDFFGFKDIDFDDDKEFSDAFLLKGENEEAIRAYFDPLRRKKFMDYRDVTIEARGDTFIFYRPKVRVKTEEIRTLMERAFAIYTLLSVSE
ncbi:MAG: hypothetical protein AAF483_05400 [Planctomycetota bacterium]